MRQANDALKGYGNTENELILRDYLAIDRTVLANERTLLAYVRTCLGFFAAGIALIDYIENGALIVLGYIFIVASILILTFGLYRFIKANCKFKRICTKGSKT